MASRLRAALLRCLVIGAVAIAIAAVLVGLHQLTASRPGPWRAPSNFANRSLGTAILETTFLPGSFYLRRLISAGPLPLDTDRPGMPAGAGTVVAGNPRR